MKIDIQRAEQLATQGKPWTFRLVRITPQDQQYVYATGRGLTEALEVGRGRVNTLPTLNLSNWADIRVEVASLVGTGFVYADTPYIRMSAANLAQVTGAPTPPVKKAVAVTSATVLPPTPPSHVNPALVALGPPYSLIRSLRVLRDNVKVTSYSALDQAGDEVLVLEASSAVDFARKYNLEVLFF